MNPWIETLGVGLFAAIGVLIGHGFSRLPKWYWTIGYFLPLTLVCLILAVGKRPELLFAAPTCWLMRGRTPFGVIGFIATVILTTPLSRVPNARSRIMISVLMMCANKWRSLGIVLKRG